MVNVCGKQVMFQESRGGFWPVVMDSTISEKIPLVLDESEIEMAVEMVKRIPEEDQPFSYVRMMVAGAISIGMKYRGS
jgi:hypothetical protein